MVRRSRDQVTETRRANLYPGTPAWAGAFKVTGPVSGALWEAVVGG